MVDGDADFGRDLNLTTPVTGDARSRHRWHPRLVLLSLSLPKREFKR